MKRPSRSRPLVIALAVVAAAVGGFFLLAPGIAEGRMNQIDGQPLPQVSDETRTLHTSLTVVDLHSDTLLWQRDLLDEATRGHMDLPRLQAGYVALQVLSSVTKSPAGLNYDSNSAAARDNITLLAVGQLQPVRTWGSLLERTLWHGQKLARAAAESNGALFRVTDNADLGHVLTARAAGESVIGAMLSVEGLHDLEGDLANLPRLYAAGVRMAGLTHFFDNDLAGSMHGEAKGGLTQMGRAAVRQMEDMGIIVDIAHCSHQCVAEVLALARRPVVSSHGGVQATCDANRNLSDDEIRGVAATGGLVAIGFWDGAVCSTSPLAVAEAMRHVRDLVGIEHVALGSDFDGSVTTRFDTGQLVQVTQALIDAGFTEDEIRAAMGGNALRVIGAGIMPLAGSGAEVARDAA
ncbi:MAG TPA: dipeptidase [Paracoccaceae bacterium]|nr:dipeptidase [Paracoccaceae bacterium]